jgi:hypothetical protein
MEQYISKDALVAEIERLEKKNNESENVYDFGTEHALKSILSFIDSIEVKEVDLDSNIRTYLTNHFNIYEDGVLQSKKSGLPLRTYDIIKVAKHFYELGVNASNPLTWEDIKLIWNITDEMDNMPEEEFYKEVLKRFKAQKGEKV